MYRVGVALGLVAFLGFVGITGCSRRPSAERRGPFLSISPREEKKVAPSAISSGSIALALGGLPPGELKRLRDALAQSSDAAVRRAAPALFDLGLSDDDAGPAVDPLRQALPDLPALTAAANVASAPWSAPGISVRLGPDCATDTASRCVPLFAPAADHEADPLIRQGRALAWTLANATLLRVSAASHAALLEALRRAQTGPSSTIALVFGASRGAIDEAELESLRDQARQALAHLPPGAPQRPWLDALGNAPATWELPVTFDAEEVLVIPRLSALARLQDFDSEVKLARADLD
jgi:hypothetical protein